MNEAVEMIRNADAFLVSASNGLSIGEGVAIFADNAPFHQYFQPFIDKYAIHSLIEGVFAPMSEEDHKKYMQKVHQYMIDDYHGNEIYRDLLHIVQNKPYFIVTSNADTHFQINGFHKNQIFEVEGNFDGLEEGSGEWLKQRDRFQQFVRQYQDKNVLLMELGIGSRNQLIKEPLMELCAECVHWQYMTFNLPHEINILPSLQRKSTAVTGDIRANLHAISEELL